MRWLFSCLYLASCTPTVPPSIKEELARTPAGSVTVVFFTDFQCPYCRRTHEALGPVMAAHRGRIHVVLRHVPLRAHPDARGAAKAAVCAEQLDLGLPYSDALFAAVDLSEEACEELAVSRGADRSAFRSCIAAGATSERLARDEAVFDAVNGDGVPLLFVGRTRLEGQQRTKVLEATISDALLTRP